MRVDEYTGEHENVQYFTPFASFTATETQVAEDSAGVALEASETLFEGLVPAESPFNEDSISESAELAAAEREFLESLHDEDFEDAIEELMNEGAARVLADAEQWSVAPAESEVGEALSNWMAPLLAEWERASDGLAAGLENANLENISAGELEELLESMESHPGLESEIFGRIVKGLVNKAKGLVRNAVQFAKNPIKGLGDIAKRGLSTLAQGVVGIGRGLLGPLLQRLKKAGLGLLKGVLKKLVRPLTKLLPAQVRPFVPVITKALGLETTFESLAFEDDPEAENNFATELAHAFDREVAAMLYESESSAYGLESGHWENVAESFEMLEMFETFEESVHTFESYESHEDSDTEYSQAEDMVTALDNARATLAAQLSEYTGGESPVGPIQEFIPAILAIRPLLKLGLKVTGARDKLINLLAGPLASLIKGIVGPANMRRIATVVGQDPAQLIARAGVGVAFTALGLESSGHNENSIPGEALASAVEATVLRVLDELPNEALSDPLQVSAAVQRTFAESAAAYLPDRVLRSDLPERETAQEGGLWVMMPRAAAPRYRFRRYTRVCAGPIPRQVARALPWSDGGTLEQYLLDMGVVRWPVHAEIDLYEAMPGTQVGHFTRDETLPSGESPSFEEYQPLTPEAAGLLLSEPGLGRRIPSGYAGRRVLPTVPGQRFYRIRVGQLPDGRTRRPRRSVSIRWDPGHRRLSIAIRLSERRARAIQALIQRSMPAGQRDLPAVLTSLRSTLMPRLGQRIVRRLLRSGFVTDPAAAALVARGISAAALSGLSLYLQQSGAQLSAAVANSAEGVTIVLAFNGIPSTPGQVALPKIIAQPGWVNV